MQNLGKFRALGAVLRDCSHIKVDFAVPLLPIFMNVNWYLNLSLADMIDLHHAASVTILVGAKFTIFVKKGQQSWVSIGCYKLAAI